MSIIQNLAKLATKIDSSGTINYADLGNKPEVLRITSISYPGDDLAADPAGGQTITLTGAGFAAGATILVDTVVASVVTVVNSTTITFTAPAKPAGNYIVYVVNTDGSTALALPGISYSGLPAWSTTAGTLGTQYETTAVSKSLSATGDGSVAYSVISGTLPTGSTLNSSTGAITGTAPLVGGSTTYNFTIRATDSQNQDTDRAFSITVSPDVVTWSSPIDNYAVSADIGAATSLALSATSATGNSISYSANQLPDGLSVSGSNITGTPTTEQTVTTTLTATAATTSKTATRTVTWTIVAGGEPYFKYVTLLLSGNGTNAAQNNVFLDSSTNNFPITTNANTTQGSFSPYGSNWSNYFGIADASNRSLSITTGLTSMSVWTMEFFAYNSQAAWSDQGILGPWGPNLIRDSGGSLQVYLAGSSIFSTAWTKDQWNHVALSNDGTNLRLYVNGTLSATAASVTINLSSIVIGCQSTSATANDRWNGYISNFRVLNGTSLYSGSTITVPTSNLTVITNTVLLTCQSNRFKDSSTSNYAITVNGTPRVQCFSPFGPSQAYTPATYGGSGYFDGAGDYLKVTTGTIGIANSNFTIGCWFYPLNSSVVGLFDSGPGILNCFRNYTTNTIEDQNTAGAVNFANKYQVNAWNWMCISKSGTSFTVYINGTSAGVGTCSDVMSENNFVVGGINNGGDGSFYGHISDFLIKTTVAEVISPPSAPITADANTKYLLNFQNAGVYDSKMMNVVETVGNAQISTSVKKYGTGSVYFDGTGDYLILQDNPHLNMGPSTFTIEGWFYPSGNVTAGRGLFGKRANNSVVGGILFYFSTTGLTPRLLADIGGVWGVDITASSGFTNAQWNHFAVVRNGSTWTVYINGTSVASATNAGTVTTNTAAFTIMAESAAASEGTTAGYIDDLRITKGLARYTANFTPPTSALKAK